MRTELVFKPNPGRSDEQTHWRVAEQRGLSDYRVRIAPVPTVIDAEGLPVDQAQVVEISFQGDTIDTPIGRANVVVGAGVAKIMVSDATTRGVPLC